MKQQRIVLLTTAAAALALLAGCASYYDGDYADRYGCTPALFNFFFHAHPVQIAIAEYLPIAASAVLSPGPAIGATSPGAGLS